MTKNQRDPRPQIEVTVERLARQVNELMLRVALLEAQLNDKKIANPLNQESPPGR